MKKSNERVRLEYRRDAAKDQLAELERRQSEPAAVTVSPLEAELTAARRDLAEAEAELARLDEKERAAERGDPGPVDPGFNPIPGVVDQALPADVEAEHTRSGRVRS